MLLRQREVQGHYVVPRPPALVPQVLPPQRSEQGPYLPPSPQLTTRSPLPSPPPPLEVSLPYLVECPMCEGDPHLPSHIHPTCIASHMAECHGSDEKGVECPCCEAEFVATNIVAHLKRAHSLHPPPHISPPPHLPGVSSLRPAGKIPGDIALDKEKK